MQRPSFSIAVAAVTGVVTLVVSLLAAAPFVRASSLYKFVAIPEEIVLFTGVIVAFPIHGDNFRSEWHFLSYAIPFAVLINSLIAFALCRIIGFFLKTKKTKGIRA